MLLGNVEAVVVDLVVDEDVLTHRAFLQQRSHVVGVGHSGSSRLEQQQ